MNINQRPPNIVLALFLTAGAICQAILHIVLIIIKWIVACIATIVVFILLIILTPFFAAETMIVNWRRS